MLDTTVVISIFITSMILFLIVGIFVQNYSSFNKTFNEVAFEDYRYKDGFFYFQEHYKDLPWRLEGNTLVAYYNKYLIKYQIVGKKRCILYISTYIDTEILPMSIRIKDEEIINYFIILYQRLKDENDAEILRT